MDTLYYFVAILLFLLSGRLFRTRSTNTPPAPPALPILGHLHLIDKGKPLHRSLAGLAARYGPILSLRFGSRPVLLVSSAAAAEECFSKNDVAFANRPRFLAGKHMGYNYTTVTWASYGQHWRNLRRIAAVEIFSSSRISSFSAVHREEVKAMIARLAGAAGERAELRPRLFEMLMNVMMRMVAGKRYYGAGEDQVGEAEEEARDFQEIVEETFELSGATNFGDFLPVLRWVDYRGMKRRMVKLHGKKDAFMQALVDEHRRKNGSCCDDDDDDDDDRLDTKEAEKNGGKRKTIIDVLLSLQRSDPEYYTDDIIKGVSGTLLTAGTDTSVVTIEWAMSLLLNHPEALHKARAELDLQVGPERIVNESDLPNLPYLHCIVSETLRLHPPAPIIPAHESSEDCTVGGFGVPRGTMLLVSAWAIQRDPRLWADPTSFRPERFAGAGGERDGFRASWMPFGLGRRACPGEGLAMRVVGMALGALIQCFEWERGCEEVDMSEGSGLTVPRARPLEAFCKPRQFVAKALSV